MKKNRIKTAMLLALMFVLGLTGCGSTEPDVVRIGALKGPTSIGLMKLLADNEAGACENTYEFQMATGADELIPLIAKGELDLALVPANAASVVYNKTDKAVEAVDINTLGVLYLVSADESVSSIQDLGGRTVLLTGRGTTPDYALDYLLAQNGITDCKKEFKSEPAEVVAALTNEQGLVGLLPQPFVTAALLQNDSLKKVVSLGDAWREAAGEEHEMVTGVTIVRKAFLEEHPDAVERFLKEHEASAAYVTAHPDEMAPLVVQYQIVGKEPIAKLAIPDCNITCIYGEKMKKALSDYLNVLYNMDKTCVGGSLPGEDFYFAR